MTIASEIAKLISNLADCYTACTSKGATIPQNENFDNLATCIDSIPAGGSTGNVKEFLVRVIDYDGTVIKDEYLDIGETFTLPTPPTHSGLVFQSWSCPVNIVDNTVTVEDNDIIIGAVYTTASGHNEIEICLTPRNGLEIYLESTGFVDWGDGTSETITGTSATHTYSDYGTYIIQNDFSGSIPRVSLADTTSGTVYVYVGFRLAVSGTYNIYQGNIVWATKYVIMAEGTTINTMSHWFCRQFILPNGISSFISMLSATNYNAGGYYIDYIVIPYNNNIGNTSNTYSFNRFQSLKYLNIPKNVLMDVSANLMYQVPLKHFAVNHVGSTATTNFFANSYTLERLTFREGITEITDGSSDGSVRSLKYIKYPSTITTISYLQSARGYGATYDFSSCTSVPTLTNVVTGTGTGALPQYIKILVPQSLKSTWETATNWSVYASNIIGV